MYTSARREIAPSILISQISQTKTTTLTKMFQQHQGKHFYGLDLKYLKFKWGGIKP